MVQPAIPSGTALNQGLQPVASSYSTTCTSWRDSRSLGPFLHDDYKVWEWHHDVEGIKLRHIYGDKMNVYGLADDGGRCWRMEEEDQGGVACTVRERAGGEVALAISADPVVESHPPETIQEVLEKWGNSWMWRSLRMTGTLNGWWK